MAHLTLGTHTLHILLADDTRSTALPLAACLKQQGHRITHVLNGQAAVEAFVAERPDLILMDVVMPVMDGIEATRQIKALAGGSWVPVVMLTSLDRVNEVVHGLDAGADDYLTKPVQLPLLEARIRAMQRIALLQRNLSSILDNVLEAILSIDEQGRISSYNPAAERIFGYTAAEVMGRNVSMLMPTPYAREHDGYLQRYLHERTPRVIGSGRKVRGLRKNGETFPMRLSVTEIREGEVSRFIGLVVDISLEEADRERIEFLARHDTLTSLPNRTYFNSVMEELCTEGGNALHALLFIDLDGFKPINDSLGHDAGDEALRIAAQRLRQTLKAEDFVARLGGDEFVVVCRELDSSAAAVAVAERLLATLAEPMNLNGQVRQMGASIGIALTSQHGENTTALLTAADHAMYAAKRGGKGRVVVAGDNPASTRGCSNGNDRTHASGNAGAPA